MVLDCLTYNGERELLDIRLHVLDKYVDRFMVFEAKTTFSGNKKPLYFMRDEQFFKPFWKKMSYVVIDENYSQEERDLAEHSPNTIGAKHWKNEFLQKESIKKALVGTDDEDIVYIGDADEIWQPYIPERPTKLKLKVYAYKLDSRSNEQFWGTLVSAYRDIKHECLNHLRSDTMNRTQEDYGWHFTSMGGFNEVKRKLDDSYTEESYNTPYVQHSLQSRLENGIDYLGRDFTFTKDREDWPQYLKLHYDKYLHLL